DVEATFRQAYERAGAGDLLALLDLAHDDARWHVRGSEEVRGKDDGRVWLERLMDATGGSYRISAHDVLANDAHAVVLEEHACEVDGEQLTGRSVSVFHLRDGMIAEAWAHPEDPEAAAQFRRDLRLDG